MAKRHKRYGKLFVPWFLQAMEMDRIDALLRTHALINARNSKTPRRDREAILQAAVVMLGSHLEAMVEALFESSVPIVYPSLSKNERDELLNHSVRRFNNPKPSAIDALFLNLGVTHVTKRISWAAMPNSRVRAEIAALVDARHAIAHGNSGKLKRKLRGFAVTKSKIRRWKEVVDRFSQELSDRLDKAFDAA